MIEEIKYKENRRAKRTKKFFIDGNIIPLSVKEKKKVSNIEYQSRIKLLKDKENIEFKLTYKNTLYDYHLPIEYNFKGSLTYKNNVTMFKAYKDATYLFETLRQRKVIEGYFMVCEYEINHVHTHYVIKTSYSQTMLKQAIYLLFNRYNEGYNFLEQIENATHKENEIAYLVNKLNVDNKQRQSNIDYWYFN